MNFQALLSCKDEISLYELTTRLVNELEYDFWAYTARMNPGSVAQYDWVFHNFNSEMWAAYFQCSMHEDRPIADFPKEELIPRAWTLNRESIEQSSGDAASDNLYRVVYKHGVRGGVCIPIHDHGNVMGTLTMATCNTISEKKLNDRVGTSLLFSRYLHKACVHNLHRQKDASQPKLSNREVQCLTWASKGKTTWEISRVLDISEHTVNFHLRNANSKLGTINRRQAVAKCVQMGYLVA